MTEPNVDQIDAVLRNLPVLKREGFVASKLHPSEEQGGVVTMGWEEHSTEVSKLISDLYENGFVVNFDWPSWQESAREYVESAQLLKDATLEDVQKLLTTHVRKDHFCEGHFTAMIQSGHVTALLERLAELRAGR